jgi:hypothetical protein
MNWKGSSHGVMKVLSQHLPGETKENHEKPLPGVVLVDVQTKHPQMRI